MKISQLGEFGLIDVLAQIVGHPASRVIAGIGDDAAVWRSGNKIELATTDAMVENVHFKRHFGAWYDWGWKSIAINLSDIAAMGGIANYALVTVGLPGEIEVEDVRAMYRGMVDIAHHFGVGIVGGDTVSSTHVLISATVLGEAIDNDEPLKLMLRSKARVGDQICVTGYLGSSAGGLALLLREHPLDNGDAIALYEAHLRPTPRLKEGQELVNAGVIAGMDISDGLVGDVEKMCKQSRVGARIWPERLPIHPALRTTFPTTYEDLALYGGEDYELVFSAPPATVESARQAFRNKGLTPITVVGEIVCEHVGEVTLVTADGTESKAPRKGYDHFTFASRV